MRATDKADFEQLSELAGLAQSGDATAYEAFLELLVPYIRRIVRSRLGSIVDADDLTQECLLGVHKSLASYHPSRRIHPWIHAIIRYKVADHFRARARRREVTLPEGTPDVTTEERVANESAEGALTERIDIRNLVKRLPGPLCRAVVLTKLEGMSCAEAARREGVGEAALRKRVSRAYRKLAKIVEMELGTENDGG